MNEYHTVMREIAGRAMYLSEDTGNYGDYSRWCWVSEVSEANRFTSRDEAREVVQQLVAGGNVHLGDRITIQRYLTRYAGHITLTVGA